MNRAQLLPIVTDDAQHIADITIYEPLSHNAQKVDAIQRLVKNAIAGRDTTPVDLGMNSQYTIDKGAATIRFVDPMEGGNARPMITIVPRTAHKDLITHELGQAIASSFVRHDRAPIPTLSQTKRGGHGAPRP